MKNIQLPTGIPTYSGGCDRYAWTHTRKEIAMLFPDFDLFMIEKGRLGIVWPDGGRSTVGAGSFVLIPPLALVRVQKFTPALEYWFCHFNFRLLPARIHTRLQPDYAGPAGQVSTPATFSKKDAPAVHAAYRRLSALSFVEGAPPWRFESALLLLIGELKLFGAKQRPGGAEKTVASSFHDRRLSAVLAQIRSRPQTRWRVSELAGSVGLSADRLNTLSRRVTRRSVKQHVIEARFQLAFELLRQNTPERASIKEVSVKCGFASQHFFCRLFKRHFNLTPSDFRDSSVMT